MILLPVIERELRMAARNRWTYRQRFLAGAAVIGVTLWVFWDLQRSGVAQDELGSQIFEAVSLTALIVALLAGLFETADAISQERREGTLGLLYLTDLRSAHVLAGKLVALSIPSFFALATIVPILGIPFLLGGVSPAELGRTCLVLLAALGLSLSAGMLASCLAKDDRVTRVLTFGVVAIPTLILPLFRQVNFSAIWTLNHALDKNLRTVAVEDFWIGVAVQFAMVFGLLALASMAARRVWRERSTSVGWQRRLDRWRVWSSGNDEKRKRARTEMLDENPAIWLACRRRGGTALLWTILCAGLAFFGWHWAWYGRGDGNLTPVILFGFHFAVKATIALAAARALADEARTGALELLLTTPMTPQRLIEGFLYGLLRRFGLAAAFAMGITAAWALYGEQFHYLIALGWTGIAFLILDLIAIAICALWLGFRTGRAGLAACLTLLLVVALPELCGLMARAMWRGAEGLIVPGIWLVFDAALVAWAWPKFKTLREQAAERFSARSDRG